MVENLSMSDRHDEVPSRREMLLNEEESVFMRWKIVEQHAPPMLIRFDL